MKKAYYVYSIFEKLNFTAGLKAFAVLLVFSLCCSDLSAQSGLSLGSAVVDNSFLKEFDIKEDRDNATQVIKEQITILSNYQPQDGLDEAIYAARQYFLRDLAYVVSQNSGGSIVSSVSTAHSNLNTFVGRYVDSVRALVDVEGIVSDYVTLLQ